MSTIKLDNQTPLAKTHSIADCSLYFLYIISFTMSPEAEKFNGWAAMLGFVAAFGAYATTGQIIPGIF